MCVCLGFPMKTDRRWQIGNCSVVRKSLPSQTSSLERKMPRQVRDTTAHTHAQTAAFGFFSFFSPVRPLFFFFWWVSERVCVVSPILVSAPLAQSWPAKQYIIALLAVSDREANGSPFARDGPVRTDGKCRTPRQDVRIQHSSWCPLLRRHGFHDNAAGTRQ